MFFDTMKIYSNGTCPVCDQEIISDFEDPNEGMNWHIILKHPDRSICLYVTVPAVVPVSEPDVLGTISSVLGCSKPSISSNL